MREGGERETAIIFLSQSYFPTFLASGVSSLTRFSPACYLLFARLSRSVTQHTRKYNRQKTNFKVMRLFNAKKKITQRKIFLQKHSRPRLLRPNVNSCQSQSPKPSMFPYSLSLKVHAPHSQSSARHSKINFFPIGRKAGTAYSLIVVTCNIIEKPNSSQHFTLVYLAVYGARPQNSEL